MRQQGGSKGDGEQRSYGFNYDNVNRLKKADFTQYTGSTWNTTAGIDFSLKSITYDKNGNILNLNQMGVKLSTSSLIDSLVYGYSTNSNKLNYVTDLKNDTSSILGDFKEYTNDNSQDYTYDANGNMNKDNNKKIASIIYNHLNLPELITVTGKGTIDYMYDGVGNKLQKITTDNTTIPSKITKTDYINGFVYQNDTLQFISHEEGRIRPKHVNYSDTMYYDFFEKDHLGNTRVVLTDQKQQDIYPAATLETNGQNLATEKNYYDIDSTKRVNETSVTGFMAATGNNYANNNGNPPYNNNPYSNTTASSTYLYKLNGSTGLKTGLGITLRVMSGDIVDIWGKSYYHLNTGQNASNNYLITAALTTFINAFAATGAVAGAAKCATATALNGAVATTGGLNSWLGTVPTPSTGPKAYINWILFDEQFKPVASGSGFDPVSTTTDVIKSHHKTISIPRNGYLYVYCSNESNIDAFFDNLQVIHTRGPLTEETHYYPFGLTMAGISSKAARSLINRKKFNDGTELQSQEFSDGSGLELYATQFRSLDPQIGRFWQLDPIDGLSHNSSLYAFGGNNPISFNDPLGLWKDSTKMANGEMAYANNPNLAPVVVTAHKKQYVNWLNFPEGTSEQIKQEKIDQNNYRDGNLKGLVPQQIKMYDLWKQNEKDYKTMSVGAVVAIMSPLILSASPEILLALQEQSALLNNAVQDLGIDSHTYLNILAGDAKAAILKQVLRTIPMGFTSAKLLINFSNKPMDAVSAQALYQILKFVLDKSVGNKMLPSARSLLPK